MPSDGILPRIVADLILQRITILESYLFQSII